jgi:hypothetical protein
MAKKPSARDVAAARATMEYLESRGLSKAEQLKALKGEDNVFGEGARRRRGITKMAKEASKLPLTVRSKAKKKVSTPRRGGSARADKTRVSSRRKK